eukprot:gene4565-7949_t
MLFSIFFLLSGVVLLYFLNYLYTHYQKKNENKEIKGESYIFPLALLFIPEKSPITTYNLKKNFKKYGYIYKHTLGTRNIYFLSHPDDFKKVLVTDWKKFGKDEAVRTNSAFKKFSLFQLQPNEEWKRHRSLSSTAFSDSSLKYEFETNVNKITNDLINFWEPISMKNGEIDVMKDFGALTLDAIGISGFGKEFKAVENQDETFSNIISTVFGSAKFKSNLPSFIYNLPIPFLQKYKDNDVRWRKYMEEIIEERKKELEKSEKSGYTFEKTDLLSKMMSSPVQDENPFDPEELLVNTHTFIAAGHETTANTLSWVFYYLAKYPKYQEMIYKEAKSEFGGDEVLSFEKLAKGFPILKAFINETLRLKNPAFGVLRNSLEDYDFQGHKIPKKSMVVLVFCASAIDQKIWGEDAEEFRPERFLEKDMNEYRYIFTPFSMGPRVCIGKRFSEMEMILILSKAMMKFRISPTESLKDVKEKINFTMKPSVPIIVKLSPLKE